jgi:hypothetical protein
MRWGMTNASASEPVPAHLGHSRLGLSDTKDQVWSISGMPAQAAFQRRVNRHPIKTIEF